MKLNDLYNNKSHILALFSMSSYLIAYPFYFAPSGTPQMSLIFLFATVAFSFHISSVKDVASIDVVRVIGGFVGYSFLVHGYYAYSYETFGVLKYSIYYGFIGAFSIAILSLGTRGVKVIPALYLGILISLILQSILSIFDVPRSVDGRYSLFFNNPNQLGYFAILMSVLLLFFNRKYNVGSRTLFLGLLAGFYLIFHSLSKGAMLGVVLLMFIWMCVFLFKREFKNALLFLFVAPLAFGASLLNYSFAHDKYEYVNMASIKMVVEKKSSHNHLLHRSMNVEADENLHMRGYSRIGENPHLLIFGAGDGLFDRFSIKKELHSTVGVLVFNFGLVGSFVFLFFVVKIIRREPSILLLYLLPLAPYSLTHNGLRSPFFLLLLVLLISEDLFKKNAVDR